MTVPQTRTPQVVVLAGGLGTRLGDLGRKLPKALAPINGKPFLSHLLEFWRKQGFKDFVFLVAHLHQMIQDCFGDGSRLGVSILYSVESEPLGTGGALRLACPLLRGDFFLINGDTFLPVQADEIRRSMKILNTEGLLVVYDNRHPKLERSNVRLVGGRVMAYHKGEGDELDGIDAGVGLFQKSVLDRMPPDRVFSFEQVMFPKLAAMGQLGCHLTQQRYFDIGTPERIRIFEGYLQQNPL